MINNQLIQSIKDDEGWSSTLYKDSRGYWTIGFGFLVDPNKGGKLPPEVGEFWLKYLLTELSKHLSVALPWLQEKPQNIQNALMNMAYNIGIEGLLGFKDMLSYIQQGKYDKAAQEALDSLWAKQVGNRAKKIADLIRQA